MEFTKNGLIPQSFLRELRDLQIQRDNLKAKISALKKQLDKLEFNIDLKESDLLSAMEEGHKIANGRFKVVILEKEKLPRISWKQVFIKIKGEKAAEDLLNSREPEKIKEVIVEEK